jgi:hypothetical protein
MDARKRPINVQTMLLPQGGIKMTARRTFLLGLAAALVSVPAWAVSSQASPGNSAGHGPSTAPGQSKDADEHSSNHGKSGTHGNSGKSHKCKSHGVAFVLTGTLEKQTLEKNADGTYSGEIMTEGTTHANHHAKTAKGPFTVKNGRVVFSNLTDINKDGTVGLDDVVKGDGVKLIGKITTLAKKCDHTGFEAKITIRQVIFSAP